MWRALQPRLFNSAINVDLPEPQGPTTPIRISVYLALAHIDRQADCHAAHVIAPAFQHFEHHHTDIV